MTDMAFAIDTKEIYYYDDIDVGDRGMGNELPIVRRKRRSIEASKWWCSAVL